MLEYWGLYTGKLTFKRTDGIDFEETEIETDFSVHNTQYSSLWRIRGLCQLVLYTYLVAWLFKKLYQTRSIISDSIINLALCARRKGLRGTSEERQGRWSLPPPTTTCRPSHRRLAPLCLGTIVRFLLGERRKIFLWSENSFYKSNSKKITEYISRNCVKWLKILSNEDTCAISVTVWLSGWGICVFSLVFFSGYSFQPLSYEYRKKNFHWKKRPTTSTNTTLPQQ